MRRSRFEKHLRSQGCMLYHHGGKHDIWVNPRKLSQTPVPRHNELKKGTVKGICRILAIVAPRGA